MTLDHISTRQRYLGEPMTLSPHKTPLGHQHRPSLWLQTLHLGMQLLPELCINTRGSQLPLCGNLSPNAAPKTSTNSVVSPQWNSGAQPAAPRHLSMKTRKGMRMGKPSLRMRMVSRIPEYRSWVLTTSASKSPGSWGGDGEKHQQLHGQTPTYPVSTTLPVPVGQVEQAPAQAGEPQFSPSCCWV